MLVYLVQHLVSRFVKKIKRDSKCMNISSDIFFVSYVRNCFLPIEEFSGTKDEKTSLMC